LAEEAHGVRDVVTGIADGARDADLDLIGRGCRPTSCVQREARQQANSGGNRCLGLPRGRVVRHVVLRSRARPLAVAHGRREKDFLYHPGKNSSGFSEGWRAGPGRWIATHRPAATSTATAPASATPARRSARKYSLMNSTSSFPPA